MSHEFQVVADFKPMGDQPAAIDALCAGLEKGQRFQTLEGVTGSGKTFTMANVIERYNRPTLVVSHNKTLAAHFIQSLNNFCQTMPFRISSVILIIISPKRNPGYRYIH